MGCRVEVPNALTLKSGLVYKFFGTADMSQDFTIVNPQEYINKSSISGNKENYAYLDNGYLYFKPCYDCMKLMYLQDFSDPEALLADGECNVQDLEVNMPDYLIHLIMNASLPEFQLFVQRPQDIVTNKNPQS